MKIDSIKALEEKIDKLLLKQEESEDILSFGEACKYLCVSESTLYKLTSLRKIEYYKPNGKMNYFSKAQLNAYIKSRRVLKKTETFKLSKPKAGMKVR